MKKIILLFAVIILMYSFSSAQTTIPAGNVSGTWTLVGSPYLIQGTIKIPNGQTLTIEPGVTVDFQGAYRLNVQGRLLAIGSLADTINFTAANTSIGWLGIRFDTTSATNDTSKFLFCKIQYGKASGSSPYDKGGAFYIYNFSKVIISNNAIINNSASFGGGIYCSNSSLIISNNTILKNKASTGSGIQCYQSSPTITFNTIMNDTTSGTGGGIECDQSSNPTISNNTISKNTATSSGGGIYCTTNSNPIISNNTISYNKASSSSGGGGGIYCYQTNPTISNNTISYNTASSSYGGGIYSSSDSQTISNNTITNNSATYGGGIYCSTNNNIISNNIISNNWGGYGGGIYCSSNSKPTISNNTLSYNSSGRGGGIYCDNSSIPLIIKNKITNNTANNYGGGIYCYSSSSPTVSNNTITNNSASSNGGGIYCTGSSPHVFNNTISNNAATKGGALWCGSFSNSICKNTIFWGNTASSSGSQVYLNDEGSDPKFYFCDVQGDSSAFGMNGILLYSGIYLNNIDTVPFFVLPTGGSGSTYNGLSAVWSLQSGSSCIDTGTIDTTGLNLPATDLAGNPRIIGGRIDIGAYECHCTLPIILTINSTDASCSTCPDGSATAIVSGGTPPFTYLWNDPSSQVTGTATGLLPGIYTIIVTDSNLCSKADSIEVSYTVSINEILNIYSINIYPNPANDNIIIEAPQKSQIEILNIQGQLIKSIATNNNKTIVDISALAKGIYMVKVQSENGVVNKKLVVQ